MDLFSIRMYFEQRYYQVKEWFAVQRDTVYTNGDFVTDMLQLGAVIALAIALWR